MLRPIVKPLFFLSLFSLLVADPIPDECGYFSTALSTRATCDVSPAGGITFSGQANIYDNPSSSLTTCSVTTPQWILDATETCEGADCVAKPGYAKSLTINYDESPSIISLATSPSNSSSDITVDADITLDDYRYDDINFNPAGENKTLTFYQNSWRAKTLVVNNITNAWNILFKDDENIEIGTISSATYNQPFSLKTDATASINIIEIKNVDFKEGSDIDLSASSSISIESFSIGRGSSSIVLKAPAINMNALTVSNSGSGIANITLIADNLDIGSIDMGQDATITVLPYTSNTDITLKANTITASSSSSLLLSSGNYYTDSFNIPGTSDASSVAAYDSDQVVNLYIDGDFSPGNSPGINSTGNSGAFGTLPASNFRLFVNGDLSTGGGGTTFNATVYVEGDATLGNPTYLKGSLSANENISIGQGSEIYYSSDYSEEAYYDCPVEGADDICYSSSSEECLDGECITTTQIRSLSDDESLVNTIVYFDTSNLFSFMGMFGGGSVDDCAVDEGAKGDNCEEKDSTAALAFGPMSMFENSGWVFNLDTVSPDENRSISVYDDSGGFLDMMNSFFSSEGALQARYVKDGVTYVGALEECSGGGTDPLSEQAGRVDAVDDPSTTQANYNSDLSQHYIKTKVVNKSPYTATAVFLDEDNTTAIPYPGGTSFSEPLHVVYSITKDNTSCTAPDEYLIPVSGDSVVSIIPVNSTTAESNEYGIPVDFATQEAYLKMVYIDFNKLMDEKNINCGASSLDGNMKGIPQCVGNSASSDTTSCTTGTISPSTSEYIKLFGCDAYERCLVSTDACDSSAYNNQGGVPDAPYDSPYGCVMCSVGSVCSFAKDPFAVRPDRFELSSNHEHMPDLLRSGSDYNLTIHAYDYDTVGHIDINSIDYNQSKTNMKVNESTVLANDGSTASLNGTTGWSTTASFTIEDGSTVDGDVADVTFNDVGKVNLKVKDKNWAAVDINNPNDQTPKDCSADGAYICGDKNVTFIPHHFAFTDINISNNNGLPGTFTYIANLEDGNISTYNMAARIQTTIVSQNEDNETTLNFRSGGKYYENPVAISSSISHTLHGDANSTRIATTLLGFGTNGDENGTKTITWDENNLSKVLRFNFPREVNNSLNPFEANASDLNLSALSIYTGTAPSSPVGINGTSNGLGDGKATFIYGRTNAPRQRFIGNTGDAFIYYESFCSDTDTAGTVCNKTLLPNGTASITTNDPRWYVNSMHNSVADGQLGTVAQKNGAGIVTPGAIDNSVLGETKVTLNYNEDKGYPYKTTMQNNASSWLIYNKYNATADRNEFEVEFIGGAGSWAGKHETDVSTNADGAQKTNRRSMW